MIFGFLSEYPKFDSVKFQPI